MGVSFRLQARRKSALRGYCVCAENAYDGDVRNGEPKMTAAQYRAALDRLGLSQAGAAAWLHISLRTAHGYANGANIPEPTAKLLRLCLRLNLSTEDVR
jgi:hypothetical protein